jgi:DNA modification methylase
MMIRVESLSDDVTLYQGDCREILPTLGRFDAVVTDPPYGMSFQSNYRTEKHLVIANDGNLECLQWTASLEASHSKYVFCRWDNIVDVQRPKSCITWVKNNWSMGDLEHEHARQTEIALFYPGPEHFFPKMRPTDVIKAPRTNNENHPTEKPVQLMRVIIEWTHGHVCDPFMGSGTTGVAAVKLGRKFTGIELEQKYFDIACRRISEAMKQPDMFVLQSKTEAKQEALI